ncbi:ATP synthase F1 subunit epsilon [Mycoplasmopsis cynos]|uniref:ATP synthase epsilon chain n=2 Tax=Mycoplasmopsis cynos TaxID=171284 RepID=A0A449AI16_9BACT|nr:ATP synthase F1 subunit epsilon [Mycoplasmopsis cynos]TQC54880.1 ATP synthase F1 subunit epsilon [Mycoplasmopsis cynos]WQQ13464.1 ATP synthase F1 subunit epsilon [Mycoplasmopsis cynos]WQQ13739.1 ATP synthase F1 subunit epsilon [Mycoplasmopsis cynos]WQQ15034.1 ATP synthase F1 subunit epsilon [Mycoplasmopsis cynos]WQQ15455.1 ATP synthase F1 subunit epsilon [Mycoplasmopsis cynos]
MATTHLNITIPSGIFFEGDVEIVTLRSSTGYIGLQPNRSPLFSSIDIGILTIGWSTDESSEKYYIGGGLVYAEAKKINIITDDIINLKDIDINQVIKEKEALEKTILQSAKGDVDIEKLEIQLKKTLFKIDSYNILNKN